MPTEQIDKGPKFEIRAWSPGGRCQVLDFLNELKINVPLDYVRLLNIIKRTVNEGIFHNNRQNRSLGNDIFEFKAVGTSRIMFFYDEGKLIICSHGFTGKKGGEKKFINSQIKKAIDARTEYFNELRSAK